MGTIVSNIGSKIYPDGWFSVGAIPRKKKRDEDKKYDRDYEQQFDRAFIKPFTAILDAIGWTTERQVTLDDIFGED